MTDVSPFRGVRYNPEKIRDIARVTAPPYDMISPEEQRALHDRDPHNVVRLILGYQRPEDTPEDNRYTRAATALREWLDGGVLCRDERPAVYVYQQEYSLPRVPRLTRRGFIARVRLEELGSGSIHPHERTLSGPKEDRLRLMETCHANFSQVFSFYDDPVGTVEGIIDRALPPRPLHDLTDGAGVHHTLWMFADATVTQEIAAAMRSRNLFIADGHHRYETALTFRSRMRERLGSSCPEGYDHIMMYFANMAAPGMTILPFHRLVPLPADGPGAVTARLAAWGDLREIAPAGDRAATMGRLLEEMAAVAPHEHRFGILIPPRAYLLGRRATAREGSPASLVESLDVSIVHGSLLPAVLGGEADSAAIAYHTRESDVLEALDSGRYGMAVLLNPTRIGQVRDIAAAGLRMPPKSTNFHPKLLSGLVLNLLDR